MKFILPFLLLTISCSGLVGKKSPRPGKSEYNLFDVGGRFKVRREQKLIDKKLISRTQILSTTGGGNKVLEKSITLSQLGSIKQGSSRVRVLRPLASEFTVWLEGKRYSSKTKLDPANKSLIVNLESPEAKWRGVRRYKFPQGRAFCFYSQIPDCLYHNGLLEKAKASSQSQGFYVIWDAFPFIQEQLINVGKNIFAPASLKYDGTDKKLLRFAVEVEGQVVLYHFSKSYDFEKMAWIAQGITILPLGEEISSVEE